MAKKSTKKNSVQMKNVNKYRDKNAYVNYYLLLMFSIFPLFYTNNYSNIRHDKLNFYLILSAILIIVQGIILIGTVFGNYKNGIINQEKWYHQLSITDYAFGALVLFCTVSTVFSKYPFDSFTGTQGRNNGLMLLFIYFLVYIILSRLFQFKEYVFAVLGGSCIIVMILCILNRFYIDPMGMYIGYSEKVAADFTSTIGNRNLMSCFCCIVIPVFTLLYLNSKKRLRYFYFAVAAISFPAALCADSEGLFLGLVPLIAIVFIYYIRNIEKLRDYFILISAMLIMGKLLILFGKGKGFGTIQSILIYSNISYLLIGASLVVTALLFLINKKQPELILPKWVQYTAIGIFIAGIIAIIALIIYYTFIDKETALSSSLSYFRFNEKWGTHRGYMWIKSIEIFSGSDLITKLFGTGPDTFYSAFAPYFFELNEKYGNSSTNCAHNEFLNYLITIGIMGLASYITLVVSVVVRAFRKAKENPLTIVFSSAIICYLFQSIVNIAQPITTPFLFIFIALTESVSRDKINK